MAELRISLQYQSIGDRLSRLRKDGIGHARVKQRTGYMSPLDRQRSMDLDKNMKDNRLRLQQVPSGHTYAAMVSPRKVGIARRMNRCPTEESTNQSMSMLDQSILSSRPANRVPGRIMKNFRSPQKEQFLSFMKSNLK